MLSYFRKLDWFLIVLSILLVSFGLLSIYSSSSGRGDFLNFKKQIIFFAIGLLVMIFLGFFDWRVLRDSPYFILVLYIVCLFLLIGLLLFVSPTRGVRGWYKFGSLALDPVEMTKIVLIIILAKYFSMRHIEMYRMKHIILSGFYVLVPTVLIFRQPNLGSALMLIFLWIGILIISGIKPRHFLLLTLCGIIIFMLGWFFFLKGYQKERIAAFFTPDVDPLGVNWSHTQSKIAIGSGGLFGKGFTNGSQARYGFLPEPHTDFIFAAIAEEFGLVGVAVLFIVYLLLIWRIIKIALKAPSNFPRLFATGFTIVLVSQIFINVGMNLGLLPVIGISLPFVSYGGSGLISLFAGLGILQSIKTH